ncbi:hypothetical protein CWI84_04680 [Idiomarina tyrosinivorans]|uniref:Flagellar hook-length control protein-like C-terminal domain-containing protein n=1 Tax=Idiomarina tyrosinivorans TaxID=1445662 RepID=A0A432ZSM7_9GAMM|nr:flagellar hook-length control protein FliK [Idiomarina tyrosinivorans]RUO80883.1 hypothetical protein CWI84_04680 [Idiomarina tyrosinivorans]
MQQLKQSEITAVFLQQETKGSRDTAEQSSNAGEFAQAFASQRAKDSNASQGAPTKSGEQILFQREAIKRQKFAEAADATEEATQQVAQNQRQQDNADLEQWVELLQSMQQQLVAHQQDKQGQIDTKIQKPAADDASASSEQLQSLVAQLLALLKQQDSEGEQSRSVDNENQADQAATEQQAAESAQQSSAEMWQQLANLLLAQQGTAKAADAKANDADAAESPQTDAEQQAVKLLTLMQALVSAAHGEQQPSPEQIKGQVPADGSTSVATAALSQQQRQALLEKLQQLLRQANSAKAATPVNDIATKGGDDSLKNLAAELTALLNKADKSVAPSNTVDKGQATETLVAGSQARTIPATMSDTRKEGPKITLPGTAAAEGTSGTQAKAVEGQPLSSNDSAQQAPKADAKSAAEQLAATIQQRVLAQQTDSAPSNITATWQSTNATVAASNISATATAQNANLVGAAGQQAIDITHAEAPRMLQERISIMMSQGAQRAEIRLDPPDLGSLHIRIHTHQDQATVQFQVQNPQAREAIEQALPRLREMLEQQGLQLADSQVGEQLQGDERETAEANSGSRGLGAASDEADAVELTMAAGELLLDAGQVDFYV